MNTANITAARELLKNFPLLSSISAIGQIAAMLALDWATAEQVYNSVVGA